MINGTLEKFILRAGRPAIGMISPNTLASTILMDMSRLTVTSDRVVKKLLLFKVLLFIRILLN